MCIRDSFEAVQRDLELLTGYEIPRAEYKLQKLPLRDAYATLVKSNDKTSSDLNARPVWMVEIPEAIGKKIANGSRLGLVTYAWKEMSRLKTNLSTKEQQKLAQAAENTNIKTESFGSANGLYQRNKLQLRGAMSRLHPYQARQLLSERNNPQKPKLTRFR